MFILKSIRNQISAISVLTLFVMLVSATCAFAIVCPGAGGDFTVSSGTTETTQPLDGGDTGAIEKGGAIVPRVDEEGICINGVKNIVKNRGSISTKNTGSIGIFLSHSDSNTIKNYFWWVISIIRC